MIAISFNQKYEDRVSIFFKNSRLRQIGIEYSFEEEPSNIDQTKKAYWLIKPMHNKQINIVLSTLKELKIIMGIDDLQFCYCYSKKEYFSQYSPDTGIIPWFEV